MVTSLLLILLLRGVAGTPEIKARLYTNVILPCEVQFVKGPEGLYVSWEKEGREDHVVVHSFHHNADHPEEQAAQFRERTSLSKELARGSLSLELKEVTSSDAGTYLCRAADSKNRGDKVIRLTVEDLEATEPTVSVEERNGKRVLKCTSSGLYKNPSVHWHDRMPTNLTSYAETNVSEKQSDGTRTVESVLNFPFTINEHYFCHIQEEKLKRSVRAVPSDGKPVMLNDEL
ncbi:butyrophilin-like protein 1 [Rhinatrema bivittatum]|uniref:butyrophilin-like protein 1 n=1 Tax=Rhinatrema bivittatum TaxID=194408 RepID=UPI001125F8CE|nr:butyrophilin-like protein 1 [Rhinatrema bivittatum]